MVKINYGDHFVWINMIKTKWYNIYDLTYQYNIYLNVFIGKYSKLNWLEENMFGCNYSINLKRKHKK